LAIAAAEGYAQKGGRRITEGASPVRDHPYALVCHPDGRTAFFIRADDPADPSVWDLCRSDYSGMPGIHVVMSGCSPGSINRIF